MKDFGWDIVPGARPAAGFNNTPGGSLASEELNASVDALLRAAAERSDVTLIAEPMVLLSDGNHAQIDLVEKRPYVDQRTTYSDGVQTQSIQTEFLEVGISIELTVRDGGSGTVVLESDITITEETGNVGGVPVVMEQKLVNRATIRKDVVSLLGGLMRRRDEDTVRALFSWGDNKDLSNELLQVWVRIYEVE